jgi:hypothetical protein
MNYSTSTERATDRIPAVIAWSATEVDAYSEPPFPEDAFCIQLAVLDGERHILQTEAGKSDATFWPHLSTLRQNC